LAARDGDVYPQQLKPTFILSQDEVDYILIGNRGLYMISRCERDEWSLTPDPVATRRIVDGHGAFFAAMDDPWV